MSSSSLGSLDKKRNKVPFFVEQKVASSSPFFYLANRIQFTFYQLTGIQPQFLIHFVVISLGKCTHMYWPLYSKMSCEDLNLSSVELV
jgi:hypothetical protein